MIAVLAWAWWVLAQNPTGDYAPGIADALRAEAPGWSASEASELVRALEAVFRSHAAVPEPRRREAIEGLRLLARWAAPEVKPMYSGQWAHLNERVPLPPEFREREFAASRAFLSAALEGGLSRRAPTEEERSVIKGQMEYLYGHARAIIAPNLGGERSLLALDQEIRRGRGYLDSTLGNAFRLGVDRPLSKEEIDDVLQAVRAEATKLSGLEVEPETDEPAYDEERWRANVQKLELLGDVARTVGRAEVLCHPLAFRALQERDQVHAEYRAWFKSRSAELKTDFEAQEKAVWQGLQADRDRRMAQRRAERSAASPTSPQPDPPPPEAPATPAQLPEPEARPSALLAALILAATGAAVAATVWIRTRHRASHSA